MRKHEVIPAAEDLGVQKQFWNGWIAKNLEKANMDPLTLRPGETVMKLLSGLSLLRPTILEVGCANGWLSTALAQVGLFTGIDLADEAIATARAKHPEVAFIAGDFLETALPMGHFDVVVALSVIGVVDQRRFLDRTCELLKPRGYLILTCPNKFVWDRTNFTRQSHGEICLNWLNMKDLKGLLHGHFSVVHAETIIPAGNRGILRLVNSRRLNKLIQRIVPESYVVRAKEKMGLGRALVVVAQKRR